MARSTTQVTHAELARQLVRVAGLRCTQERLQVLEVLMVLHTPLSVDELSARVSDVHRVTLYRMLEQFADAGIVERVHLADGKRRYEYQAEHHHHVTCTMCGDRERVQIPEQVLHDATRHTKRFATISAHTLEFYGLCRRCAS